MVKLGLPLGKLGLDADHVVDISGPGEQRSDPFHTAPLRGDPGLDVDHLLGDVLGGADAVADLAERFEPSHEVGVGFCRYSEGDVRGFPALDGLCSDESTRRRRHLRCLPRRRDDIVHLDGQVDGIDDVAIRRVEQYHWLSLCRAGVLLRRAFTSSQVLGGRLRVGCRRSAAAVCPSGAGPVTLIVATGAPCDTV